MNQSLRLTLTLAITIFVSNSTLLYGKALVSTPIDSLRSQQNPWFIKKTSFTNNQEAKAVTWCVQYGDGVFSVSKKQSILQIERALNDWQQTFKSLKNVMSDRFVDGNVYTLNLDFKYVNACSAEVDLTFYLGQAPAQDNYKAIPDANTNPTHGFAQAVDGNHVRRDLAYAQMTYWDPVSESARGFIWLTPDRRHSIEDLSQKFWNPHGIFCVVLHELGHVFGFSHDFLGLMDGRFPLRAAKKAADWAATLSQRQRSSIQNAVAISKTLASPFGDLDVIGLNPSSRAISRMAWWHTYSAIPGTGCTLLALPSGTGNPMGAIFGLDKKSADLYKLCYRFVDGFASVTIEGVHTRILKAIRFRIFDRHSRRNYKTVHGFYNIAGHLKKIDFLRLPFIHVDGVIQAKGRSYQVSLRGFNRRKLSIVAADSADSVNSKYNFIVSFPLWAGIAHPIYEKSRLSLRQVSPVLPLF